MNHSDLNDETKLKKITVPMLKEECDKLKIVYSSKSKKSDLVSLILENDRKHLKATPPKGEQSKEMASVDEKSKNKVTMPAGTYFLGDPCYAVPDKLWEKWLNDSNYGINLIGKVNSRNVLGFATAFGDGCYLDQVGNQYGVDAGLIGLTPIEVIDADAKELKRLMALGIFVTFFEPVVCETTNKGSILKFGKYEINTGDEED